MERSGFAQMNSIFEFIDYRKYLLAYYNEQKKKHRFFSYRYFSDKAGIGSPSFLKQVIDGKRNLTGPVIEKFSNAMKLEPKQALYFLNMVLFNQAKTSVEKQKHYAALRSMTGNLKVSVINGDLFDYFSEWYVPVIREVVTMYDFKDDYKAIAAMINPPVQPSEAKAAIKLLLRLKLLKRQDNGSYVQKDTTLVADSSVLSLALQSFTKTMIDHSKFALEKYSVQERHISGITMGISPETFALLNDEIDAFKDRVKSIVNRDVKNKIVYQLNLALFPLSKNIDIVEDRKDQAD